MRRKRRKWFALVFALASGGAAAYLALNTMQEPLAARPASGGGTAARVVVAARDLPVGSVLAATDVKVVEWPATAVPPGYATDPRSVVGRGLITSVSANEPLLARKMASMEEGGGLPIVIPEGMRAVSVKVDEVIGVAGFVLPGTRVDVLATLSPTSGNNESATRVILQNVQALAAGQTIQRDAEGTPQTVTVITLLVNPEDAEKLTLAATEGQIQLALRNTLDMGQVDTKGVDAGTLVQSSPVSAPRQAAALGRAPRGPRPSPGTTVVTYNGAERTETTF
jgi:pilus assembly protein CpaB